MTKPMEGRMNVKTIEVREPKDVRKHFKNMAAVIAEAMLKHTGEYTCTIGTQKVRVVVK